MYHYVNNMYTTIYSILLYFLKKSNGQVKPNASVFLGSELAPDFTKIMSQNKSQWLTDLTVHIALHYILYLPLQKKLVWGSSWVVHQLTVASTPDKFYSIYFNPQEKGHITLCFIL